MVRFVWVERNGDQLGFGRGYRLIGQLESAGEIGFLISRIWAGRINRRVEGRPSVGWNLVRCLLYLAFSKYHGAWKI